MELESTANQNGANRLLRVKFGQGTVIHNDAHVRRAIAAEHRRVLVCSQTFELTSAELDIAVGMPSFAP
ncbi:hypothetical protein [Streptomyces sp. C36]|uniref:hypothetical protein n=1 Tax=Streptomyces sp. C36 TaxID=3237122 RepID=UPI0034C64FF3